jgi:molybdopterin synthase catalytic subunit
MLKVSEDPIDASALLKAFETEAAGAGAIVSFSGIVRSKATSGAVEHLFLQAYSPMTEDGIQAAMVEAQSRWPIVNALVQHRVGEMKAGETIVFVATASAHRRASFEAADFLMDYLKTKAVFWKREKTDRGDAWIEPCDSDYADAERWR